MLGTKKRSRDPLESGLESRHTVERIPWELAGGGAMRPPIRKQATWKVRRMDTRMPSLRPLRFSKIVPEKKGNIFQLCKTIGGLDFSVL